MATPPRKWPDYALATLEAVVCALKAVNRLCEQNDNAIKEAQQLIVAGRDNEAIIVLANARSAGNSISAKATAAIAALLGARAGYYEAISE